MSAHPDFKLLSRGSLIQQWSPSGELTRFIVVAGPMSVDVEESLTGQFFAGVTGYKVVRINDANEMQIANEHLTETDIDVQEGFGCSHTYWLGEVFKLPEWLT